MLAILQFDASSVSLLERLLSEGRMPALSALRAAGRWQELEGCGGYLEGAVATTLHSGVEVTEHGIYFPFQWSADDQRIRFADRFPAPDFLWDRLGHAGRRALLIDPYDGREPRTFTGIALSGWQFTNRVVLRRWSVPAPTHRRLRRRFGRPPSGEEIFGRPRLSPLLRLRRVLLAAPTRVADVATELLAGEPFDLVWINFAASHLAGHQFWDLSQFSSNGEHLSADARRQLETTLADVYAAIDAAIGRIAESLPPDADIIVLSPSGMAANRSRSHFLPGMLEAVLDGPSSGVKPGATGGAALERIRASFPTGLRAGLARLLPDPVALELTARLAVSRRDWDRTRAFVVPCDPEGYVRLNLKGRERDGIVDPDDADGLADELAAGLATFRDPDGAPAVAGVDRTLDLVPPGPRSRVLPDLVVRWRDRSANGIARLSSPRFGEVAGPAWGSGRSGDHIGQAWILTVPRGSRWREPSRSPKLVDVAATACSLLGAETEGLAGEPLLSSTSPGLS